MKLKIETQKFFFYCKCKEHMKYNKTLNEAYSTRVVE